MRGDPVIIAVYDYLAGVKRRLRAQHEHQTTTLTKPVTDALDQTAWSGIPQDHQQVLRQYGAQDHVIGPITELDVSFVRSVGCPRVDDTILLEWRRQGSDRWASTLILPHDPLHDACRTLMAFRVSDPYPARAELVARLMERASDALTEAQARNLLFQLCPDGAGILRALKDEPELPAREVLPADLILRFRALLTALDAAEEKEGSTSAELEGSPWLKSVVDA